jgi:hypothetical protein
VDEFLDPRHAQRADELVLQIRRADEELPLRHTGALQPPDVEAAFRLVAQSRQAQAQAGRAEETGETSDAHRAAHRQDADSLGRQVPAAARGQRVHRCGVARPFEQDGGPDGQQRGQFARGVAGATGRPCGDRVPERPHVSHGRSLGPFRASG